MHFLVVFQAIGWSKHETEKGMRFTKLYLPLLSSQILLLYANDDKRTTCVMNSHSIVFAQVNCSLTCAGLKPNQHVSL